jgi:hypothetical protein
MAKIIKRRQFIILQKLGWAHTADGAPVLCHLLTARDSDMLIPGGSLIIGEVGYDDEESGVYTEMFQELPREARRALRAAVVANNEQEESVRAEGESPQALAYMPTSIIIDAGKEREKVNTPRMWTTIDMRERYESYAYIVAFTQDDAADAAIAAGFAGQTNDSSGQYSGMVWRRLIERAEWSARMKEIEAAQPQG